MGWWMCKIIHKCQQRNGKIRGHLHKGNLCSCPLSAGWELKAPQAPHNLHSYLPWCTRSPLCSLQLSSRALQALSAHSLSPQGPLGLLPSSLRFTRDHTPAHSNTASPSLPPQPLSLTLLERSPSDILFICHLSPSDILFICPFIKVKGQKGRDYAFITIVPS